VRQEVFPRTQQFYETFTASAALVEKYDDQGRVTGYSFVWPQGAYIGKCDFKTKGGNYVSGGKIYATSIDYSGKVRLSYRDDKGKFLGWHTVQAGKWFIRRWSHIGGSPSLDVCATQAMEMMHVDVLTETVYRKMNGNYQLMRGDK
jgi:hypothetical protein